MKSKKLLLIIIFSAISLPIISSSENIQRARRVRPEDYKRIDYERYQNEIDQILRGRTPDDTKRELMQPFQILQAQILQQRQQLREEQNEAR